MAPLTDVPMQRQPLWGVYDTWQSRWCPRQPMLYREADEAMQEYNRREAIGSKRYETRRLPDAPPPTPEAGTPKGE